MQRVVDAELIRLRSDLAHCPHLPAGSLRVLLFVAARPQGYTGSRAALALSLGDRHAADRLTRNGVRTALDALHRLGLVERITGDSRTPTWRASQAECRRCSADRATVTALLTDVLGANAPSPTRPGPTTP